MTSLDDHLRDLFQSVGPDAAELRGDVRQVRARVRRRTLRRRAVFGAVAAAIVAGGGLLIRGEGDDVRTDVPPVSRPETAVTTAPGRSTTEPTGTTSPNSSTNSTSSTSTSTSTSTTPPAPSIRDVALGEATYAAACAGYDDTRAAELSRGSAQLPIGSGSHYEVDLGAVGYADADGDGDGDEDALLLLRCTFAGADTDNTAQLRAYRATGDGSIEQIGTSQVIEHVFSATAEGQRITVVVEKYEAGDAACCPSSAAREVWRFDGRQFVLEQTTPTSTPNTPG